MNDYLKDTFEYIVEAHTLKLLDEKIIKRRSNASSYFKKSFVEFHEQDGKFNFNFFFRRSVPLSAPHKARWNKELRFGEYALPEISIDTLVYETQFCFPPFWDDVIASLWNEDQVAAFSENFKREWQASLQKTEDLFAYSNFDDYSKVLNAFAEDNQNAKRLALKFRSLEIEVTSIAEELGDGKSQRLLDLACELIETGRDLERYELDCHAVFDRLKKEASLSVNHQKMDFHSLPRYEKLLVKLYYEKKMTPTGLIKELIKREVFTNPSGLAPSNKNCVLITKDGDEINSVKLIERWRNTLKKNFEGGLYPEAEPKTKFSK